MSHTLTRMSPSTYLCWPIAALLAALCACSGSTSSAANTAPPDMNPPIFSGATAATAVSDTGIQVDWNAAVDDRDPQGAIVYNVYVALTSGGQNFASPDVTSPAGAANQAVTGLNPATTYYFVVRAEDTSGNEDANTVEVFATTTAGPDVTPPVFAGATSAAAIDSTSIQVDWNPAADDTDPPSAIIYNTYMATSSGGQNFTSPDATSLAGATSHVMTGLGPSTTYYFVVRAQDTAGNEDSNLVEVSDTTPAPPTFQINGTVPFNDIGDIWAEGTTIYLAGRFAGEVYIVDASNPDVPTLVGTISGLGIPQDVKAQNGILYITNEAGGPVGLWIYDVSNPAMPTLLGTLTSAGLANIHNVFVDGDYAYVASNATGDVHVIDVRNPAAPMNIGRIPRPGGGQAHDMMARGGICYVAFLGGGFTIADVSTPSAPVVLRNHTYPGNFTHSIWPSDDGRHVFTTDELVGGHLKAFDISDLGNIQQVGSYEAIPNIIIHNAVIDGRYAYISYYVEGLHIVDISDPSNITKVANFDTYTCGTCRDSDGFAGAWGVYPFTRPYVYVSDLNSGLYIFTF